MIKEFCNGGVACSFLKPRPLLQNSLVLILPMKTSTFIFKSNSAFLKLCAKVPSHYHCIRCMKQKLINCISILFSSNQGFLKLNLLQLYLPSRSRELLACQKFMTILMGHKAACVGKHRSIYPNDLPMTSNSLFFAVSNMFPSF